MKISYSKMNLLNLCISQILVTSESLPGGVIHNLNRNAGLLEKPLKELEKTRKKIIDQYVDKDKDGNHKYVKQTDEEEKNKVPKVLAFPKGNEDKANEELEAIYDSELDIEFFKLPLSKFETLTLNTSKIPGINVYMDSIIDDDN